MLLKSSINANWIRGCETTSSNFSPFSPLFAILLELRIYGNSIARRRFDSKWQEGRGTTTGVAQLSADSSVQFQILWPRKLVAWFHVFLFRWLQHYYSSWNLVRNLARKQPHLVTILSISRATRYSSVSYIFTNNFRKSQQFSNCFYFFSRFVGSFIWTFEIRSI